MGRKVHPYGFRVGVYKDWQSKWFAERGYADLVAEDIKLRNVILNALPDAGVSQILIDRNANQITMTVKTAKPGIVIGRGGQNAEMLRTLLQNSTDKRVRLNIEEINPRGSMLSRCPIAAPGNSRSDLSAPSLYCRGDVQMARRAPASR